MIPSHHLARNFTVEKEDLEFLSGLLLERETPLTTGELAHALIDNRLKQEIAALKERYKDARFYNPSHSYNVGEKVIFPVFEYQAATVVSVRPGNNPDYGDFNVIAVQFEDTDDGDATDVREFAADLHLPHKLSAEEANNGSNPLVELAKVSPEDILGAASGDIIPQLEEALRSSSDLVSVAGKWFPRDLILEVNEGHLNLAEAVLDIASGGPLSTETILREIGGLGSAPQELQTFSLNYTLNQDGRFDEIGPTGEVLWYLMRLEPADVQQTPTMLRYTPVEYDASVLTPDMVELEAEIDDELSAIQTSSTPSTAATITLIYPHRRIGTLPLNASTAAVFPTARRTPRVWVRLLDGQDGEEYPGWVVRSERYVYGLDKFYRKHQLPIGAFLTVSRAAEAGKVIVDYHAHRPRTEWIRLIVPAGGQLQFENHKRSIGAEYDELMILGADNIAAVDDLFQITQQQKKSLASLLRSIIPALGRLNPQGTVHAKTLYSAVNVIRRCPPGPIFAALVANPDFENVGGHYWTLSAD